MKYDVAMKWVKALRSGKYKQTKSNLQDASGYCCLGVLCDLAPKSLVKRHSNMIDGGQLRDQPEVMTWSGFKTGLGSIEGTDLATLNDKGADIYESNVFSSFTESLTLDEIADIIQINWRKL